MAICKGRISESVAAPLPQLSAPLPDKASKNLQDFVNKMGHYLRRKEKDISGSKCDKWMEPMDSGNNPPMSYCLFIFRSEWEFLPWELTKDSFKKYDHNLGAKNQIKHWLIEWLHSSWA